LKKRDHRDHGANDGRNNIEREQQLKYVWLR
jgi:hypothetical protein